MQKWEYLIAKDLTQEKINSLGAEGWELVAVTSSSVTGKLFYYFKRPI